MLLFCILCHWLDTIRQCSGTGGPAQRQTRNNAFIGQPFQENCNNSLEDFGQKQSQQILNEKHLFSK